MEDYYRETRFWSSVGANQGTPAKYFDFISDEVAEIARFFQREHMSTVPLTVREILDETIAHHLA